MNRLAYLFEVGQGFTKPISSGEAHCPEPGLRPQEDKSNPGTGGYIHVPFFSTIISINPSNNYLLPMPISVQGKLAYQFSQPLLPQYIRAWVDEQKRWNDPDRSPADAIKDEINSSLFEISIFNHWCNQVSVNSRGKINPMIRGLSQVAVGVNNTRRVLEDMLNAIHADEMHTHPYLVKGFSPN